MRGPQRAARSHPLLPPLPLVAPGGMRAKAIQTDSVLFLRTTSSSFDAIQHLPLRLRQVGHGQSDARRKLEPQIRFAVDAQLATGQPELEDVSTGVPVRGYEVKVGACDVNPLGVVGKTETQEASPDAVEFEGGLALDDLGEGRVGLALAGYAARLDVVKVPVYANGVAGSLAADEPIQVRTERFEIHRRGQRSRQVRLEEGNDGKRGSHLFAHRISSSVRLHLVEVAVKRDHLAV